MEPTQKTTQTKRTIYTCKACKSVKTIDHVFETTWRTENNGKVYGSRVCVEPNGTRVPDYQMDRQYSRCACGAFYKSAIVKGTVTDHLCNDECLSARGPRCECSCGGKNHGGAHLQAA